MGTGFYTEGFQFGFHRPQHGLAEQLEMVDTTGDFYMKIVNQTFLFVNK
jgi:hypothetical protein